MATDSQFIKSNDLLIKELECPICLDHCTPPVYMCRSGHNVCASCVQGIKACPVCQGPKPTNRNLLAETTLANLRFPCRNVDSGCKARFSLEDLKAHAQKCVFNFHCQQIEIFDVDKMIFRVCPWSGDRLGLVAHVRAEHPGCFLNNIADLGTLKINNYNEWIQTLRLVCVDGQYFWLSCHYNSNGMNGLGFHWLKCIVVGGEEMAERYCCEFNFRSEDGAYEQINRIPVRSQFDESIAVYDKSVDVVQSTMGHFKDKNGDLKCSVSIFLK